MTMDCGQDDGDSAFNRYVVSRDRTKLDSGLRRNGGMGVLEAASGPGPLSASHSFGLP